MIRIFYCQSSAPEIPENISEYRKSRIEKANLAEEKTRMILASKVLKAGFESFGVSEKDVAYAFGENGKPYAESHPEIKFSLSHTENFAIAAFSDCEIGIDCEKNDRAVSDKVLNRYFPKKETLSFASSPILLWTAKESVSKLRGCGVSGFSELPELEYFTESAEFDGVFLKKMELNGFTAVISSLTDEDFTLTEIK